MPFEFYFPATVYYRDDVLAEAENTDLLDAVRAVRRAHPTSSRDNLYTTFGSLADVFGCPGFAVLREALLSDIALYLDQIETRPGRRAVLTDSWASISAPGNYERMHTHDGAYISGVYYVKTAPECGNLFFENMQDNLWASERRRRENWNSVSFEPRERRVVLFNSRLAHHVALNRSAEDRVAISFNVALE